MLQATPKTAHCSCCWCCPTHPASKSGPSLLSGFYTEMDCVALLKKVGVCASSD